MNPKRNEILIKEEYPDKAGGNVPHI